MGDQQISSEFSLLNSLWYGDEPPVIWMSGWGRDDIIGFEVFLLIFDAEFFDCYLRDAHAVIGTLIALIFLQMKEQYMSY